MPDNYKSFSNGNIKNSSQPLNSLYPKFALNSNNELLNKPLLTAADVSPYVGNPDFYIVEPTLVGWGTSYITVYAYTSGFSVVVEYVAGAVTPPTPTPSTGSWSTYSATTADGSFYYGKTIIPDFTIIEFHTT